MIRLRVMGPNFEPIVALLDRLARPDLTPLAEDIRGIMLQDMRDMLLDGVNADGSRTDDVTEATIRRGRGGDGPPRVPRGAGSRAVTDYEVEPQQSTDRILLIGGWRNTPFMHVLAGGRKDGTMPPRDMLGITPTGQGRIATATAGFARTLIGGTP